MVPSLSRPFSDSGGETSSLAAAAVFSISGSLVGMGILDGFLATQVVIRKCLNARGLVFGTV